MPFSLWALAPRVTRAQLAGFALIQAVFWIAVRAFVVSITGAPPNPKPSLPGGAEWYLWTNLRTLTYPLYAATVFVPFAGGAWLPLLAWWGERPPLARALLVWYSPGRRHRVRVRHLSRDPRVHRSGDRDMAGGDGHGARTRHGRVTAGPRLR